MIACIQWRSVLYLSNKVQVFCTEQLLLVFTWRQQTMLNIIILALQLEFFAYNIIPSGIIYLDYI